MVELHPPHNDTIQAFHTWKRSSKAHLPGIGGPDFDTTVFVPRSNLEKYFDKPHQIENLLDVVLSSRERPAVDPNYVREHYLQSFAILLSIGQPHLIHHFQQYNSLRDQKLPYHIRPEDFPDTTPDYFESFQSTQWQFCASKLEYSMNGRFKEEEILPIISKELIGEGGSAIVYRIVVDETYNLLRPHNHVIPDRRRQHNNTFALKTYRSAEAEENYRVERDAYMKLRYGGDPSSHIIAFYGGFIHGASYNIILEDADLGTLENFMRETKSPSSLEDALLFWDRLFDVLHGIQTIHGHITNHNSASQIMNGWHQDVKPANILVIGGNGASPYDCHFKIADLGLAHFKPSAPQSNDPLDFDAYGTRAYGAPETYRSHKDSDASRLQVSPQVDIWSIGCVFSEASVWAQHGWKRVEEYRRQRGAEIQDKCGIEGERMFHFDGNLLDAVENIHQDILRKKTAKDYITWSVLDHLVGDMLQHGSRPDARFLFERSKRLIKQVEKKFDISVVDLVGNTNGDLIDSSEAGTRMRSFTPVSHEYRRSRTDGELSLGQPLPPDDGSELSVFPLRPQPSPQRYHYKSASQVSDSYSNGAIESLHSGGQSSHVVPNPSPSPTAAANTYVSSPQQNLQQRPENLMQPNLSIDEGHAWKEKKKRSEFFELKGGENLTYLDQRQHVFLVDTSATMKQYSTNIKRVISLLAYMLKKSDKTGLDIYFTQTLTKVNSKKSSKIAASVAQEPFRGVTDMRSRLQTVLKDHIFNLGKSITPTKTLIGRQPPPQPQRPLSLYVLTDAKWQPTDVGGYIKDLVQQMNDRGCSKEHVAIQFIRFGHGQESIEKLDQLDHGLGLGARGMDIVDHTYWDGNVWKQLLGALNDWYDDDPA